MPHRYTATFTSTAHVVDPNERDRFLSKASIEPLKALLPAGVDPEDNPDLLYIAANGALAGLANKNGDSVSAATALAIYRTAAAKYINTDHDRTKVVGVVLYPSLTRFGSNEPLTDEEAATLNEPFNMAFAGVLWKAINPQLARYVTRIGDDQGPDALSMSWEINFNAYSIGVGSRNLWDAKVVKASEPEFNALDKRLRSNGGTGKDEKGNQLIRIIEGDAIILGYAVVERPAADVKGILPITEQSIAVSDTPSTSVEVPAAIVESTVAEIPLAGVIAGSPTTTASISKSSTTETVSEEILITHSETRVTPNIALSMKIENKDQIASQWSEIRKLESSAAVVDFVKSIEEGMADYATKLDTEKNLSKTLKDTADAAEKRAKALEDSLADTQRQVTELKNAKAAAEANVTFQERMASLDESFDLDEEDRELLAPEVRSCASDEAFAAFQKKCAKLMKSKAKKAAPFKKGDSKSDPEDKKDGGDDEDKEGEAKKGKASVTEALASVTEIPGQAVIPNATTVTSTLADEMDEAFGSAIKVDGKTVKERRADKAAKAPKE